MKVIRNVHKINAIQVPVDGSNYLAKRIGFWGIVSAQNSLNNTVTVISDTGFEYKNIPVFSTEWVTVDDNKNYIPSTRNLPPVKSRVFVLTPTYTATGAFVLCSGFSKGDENIRSLWAQSESELEAKNNCRETKTQGGWDITEEYANGNYSAKSDDGNIVFTANTTQDDNKSQVKEVSLSAWENIVTVNEDGITVTDVNGNNIAATSDGLQVTDKNNNDITATSDGITVTDKNNNKIELTSNGIKVTDKNNNVIETKNTGIKVTDKNNNVIETKNGEVDIKVGNSTIAATTSSVKINNHLEVSV